MKRAEAIRVCAPQVERMVLAINEHFGLRITVVRAEGANTPIAGGNRDGSSTLYVSKAHDARLRDVCDEIGLTATRLHRAFERMPCGRYRQGAAPIAKAQRVIFAFAREWLREG